MFFMGRGKGSDFSRPGGSLHAPATGFGEGVLGDVSVQEEVRLALPLTSPGVICCSFLQRTLRKQQRSHPTCG